MFKLPSNVIVADPPGMPGGVPVTPPAEVPRSPEPTQNNTVVPKPKNKSKSKSTYVPEGKPEPKPESKPEEKSFYVPEGSPPGTKGW